MPGRKGQDAPVRPFLKWAGGKHKLVERIKKHIVDKKNPHSRLIEPFAGSGAVMVGLGEHFDHYIGCDINGDLIALYQQLTADPEDTLQAIRSYFVPQNNTESAYLKLRQRFNELPVGDRERCHLFVFLNRHGFNGLCRYNLSGGYNVPFGLYRQPYFPEVELRAFARIAGRCQARFHCESFEKFLVQQAQTGDVVYADPPYLPLSATASFVGYAGKGFTLENQQHLADLADELRNKGIKTVISNHDTPLARKIYQKADKIQSFAVNRNIAAKGRRGKVKELMAIYQP